MGWSRSESSSSGEGEFPKLGGLSSPLFSLTADGVFGAKTNIALRNHQIKQGLLADSNAGPITLAALGIAQSLSRAPMKAPNQNRHKNLSHIGLSADRIQAAMGKSLALLPQLVGSKNLSHEGYLLIYTRQASVGVSIRLHWPGTGSGVSLGAGYDWKERTKQEGIDALRAMI